MTSITEFMDRFSQLEHDTENKFTKFREEYKLDFTKLREEHKLDFTKLETRGSKLEKEVDELGTHCKDLNDIETIILKLRTDVIIPLEARVSKLEKKVGEVGTHCIDLHDIVEMNMNLSHRIGRSATHEHLMRTR